MKMFLTRLGLRLEGRRHRRRDADRSAGRADVRPGRSAQGRGRASRASSPFHFDERDVVRHPLVQQIVKAYERVSAPAPNPAHDADARPRRRVAVSVSVSPDRPRAARGLAARWLTAHVPPGRARDRDVKLVSDARDARASTPVPRQVRADRRVVVSRQTVYLAASRMLSIT